MNNRVKDPTDIDCHIQPIKHTDPADIDYSEPVKHNDPEDIDYIEPVKQNDPADIDYQSEPEI